MLFLLHCFHFVSIYATPLFACMDDSFFFKFFNLFSQAVPEDASKLADFQKIIKVTSEFENGLKEMKFISATDSTDQKLSNFAENVEIHFATRKKMEILAKARNLLLGCDFSIPQVSF